MPARFNPTFFDSMPGMAAKRVEVDDAAELPRAVALAQSSDVTVLVLGEAQNMIGEIASRSSLDLPGRQQELLDAVVATGKPVVVLLMTARPLDLKNSKAGTLMNIWYPGTQGGTAVANLLFGDVSPGGKLPYTWPRNIAQLPQMYAHLSSHQPKAAEQRYWNETSSPLYPFGFGISYSTFEFSNLKVERQTVGPGESVPVSVDVRNTGSRAADEVAQLYIHQRHGSSARSVRELKGFQRVTLKPGETRSLRFMLTSADLSYWASAKHAWVHDETTFDVYVGNSSLAALTSAFEVKR